MTAPVHVTQCDSHPFLELLQEWWLSGQPVLHPGSLLGVCLARNGSAEPESSPLPHKIGYNFGMALTFVSKVSLSADIFSKIRLQTEHDYILLINCAQTDKSALIVVRITY